MSSVGHHSFINTCTDSNLQCWVWGNKAIIFPIISWLWRDNWLKAIIFPISWLQGDNWLESIIFPSQCWFRCGVPKGDNHGLWVPSLDKRENSHLDNNSLRGLVRRSSCRLVWRPPRWPTGRVSVIVSIMFDEMHSRVSLINTCILNSLTVLDQGLQLAQSHHLSNNQWAVE